MNRPEIEEWLESINDERLREAVRFAQERCGAVLGDEDIARLAPGDLSHLALFSGTDVDGKVLWEFLTDAAFGTASLAVLTGQPSSAIRASFASMVLVGFRLGQLEGEVAA